MKQRVGRKVLHLVLIMILVLSLMPGAALAEQGTGSIRVDISLQPLMSMGSGYEFHFLDIWEGSEYEKTETFHITNTGEGKLTGLSVSLSRMDNLYVTNESFELIAEPEETLAAGAMADFTVGVKDSASLVRGEHITNVSVRANELSTPYEFTVHIIVDPHPDSIQNHVKEITVTGHGGATTIKDKGGTLQLYAAVYPENADNPRVWWAIPSEDEEYIVATINSCSRTATRCI